MISLKITNIALAQCASGNAPPHCEVLVASECILIVDDSVESRDFLTTVLTLAGYTLLTADDTEQGLKVALDRSPDAIILSIQSPGLAGAGLVQALRQAGRDTPVLVVSLRRMEPWVVEAFRYGANGLLVRPFEAGDVLAALDRVLAGVRARRERDETIEKLNQTRRQMERQLQELNALYTIGKTVTAQLDLERVLTEVVEACVYITRAEEGSLLLLDEATNELYLRAAKNLDQRTARGLRMRVDDTVLGRVISTGRPMMLSGTELHKIKTSYLVKALLMVPLKVPPERVIGVMGVSNKIADRPFGERDVFLLSALADYASIAIENARLFTVAESERNKLEAILRGTEDAVIAVDHDRKIVLCNPAARRIFRLEPPVYPGRPLAAVTTNEDLVGLFEHFPLPGHPTVCEIALADGRVLQAQVSAIEDLGCVAIMRDITHLKELDRIKSEFVSVVSHDLRSPLTTIRGYVALLSRVGPLNDMQKDFVDKVERSMATITDLIGDLLDIGRIEAGLDQEKQVCRLDTIVQQAVENVRLSAEEKGHTLHVEIAPDLPPLLGNPQRLEQVVMNLLTNAIKYTLQPGQITVRLRQERQYLLLSVSDTGLGIPYEDQPYVFDKFYRVESKETENIPGTGLGLSIVRTIVEKHDGRVWVESTPGQGSTFSVLLPTPQRATAEH